MHPLQTINPSKNAKKDCFCLTGGIPVMTRETPVITRGAEVMTKETTVMTGELEVMSKSIPVMTEETEVMTQEIPVVTRNTKVRTNNINYYSTTTLNSKLRTGNYKQPFGWPIPGRQGTPSNYRFGYQGQFAEQDGETGWEAFELRMYGKREARWFTTDLYQQFFSPYVSAGNVPTMAIDGDGGYVFIVNDNSGVLKKSFNRAMNTEVGRSIYGRYIDSETDHIYIRAGKLPSTILKDKFGKTIGEAVTTGTTTRVGNQTVTLYNESGEIQISGETSLIKVNKGYVGNNNRIGADIIGHEGGSHNNPLTFYIDQSQVTLELRDFEHDVIWGEKDISSTPIPGSLAEEFGNQLGQIRQIQQMVNFTIYLSGAGNKYERVTSPRF